jgi:hypothetical protein
MMFAAATQGFFIAKSRIHETLILLLVTFTLFRPGYWMDMLYPPFEEVPPTELTRLVEEAPRNGNLRVWVEGLSLEGQDISKGVLLPLGEKAGSARERLGSMGLTVMALGDQVQVAAVRFGSQAEKIGLEQGYTFTRIELPSGARPDKEWMYLPAFALIALVWAMQKPRQRRHEAERLAARRS